MSTSIPINNHCKNDFDSWFLKGGNDYDTVLSSRVSLSRNLKNRLFPQAPSSKVDTVLLAELIAFICSLQDEDTPLYGGILSSLSKGERNILAERRLISIRASRDHRGGLVKNPLENISISLFHQDHFRFSGLSGGQNIGELYRSVEDLTRRVEKQYTYAWDDNFGYLTTRVEDSGLGLRSSLMVQLIMMQELEELDPFFFQLMKKGYSLRGFTDNRDEETQSSLGGFYQIYAPPINMQVDDGWVEDFLLDMESLLDRERMLRQELKDGRYPWVEDRINRSFGILKYCKLLSADEAQKRLSYIRLGITLGWIDGLSLEEVSALLILVQKGHINALMEDSGLEQPFSQDERRARFIREVFEKGLPYRR